MRIGLVGRLLWVSAIAFMVTGSYFCSTSPAHADEAYTFSVRGVVKGLPGGGRAEDEILVKHEPIPEYRDLSTGKVIGMHAMTMPFYLAPGVSLDGVSVGDKVQLKVEQHREPKVSEKVVAVVKEP